VRVFGPVGVPGLEHVAVDDVAVARLLGDADGRINRMGASLSPNGVLRLGSAPGLEVEPLDGDLEDAVVAANRDVPTAVEVQVDLDHEIQWPQPVIGRTLEGHRVPSDRRVVILAGPGVPRSGQLEKLQRFAADAGVGVLNTWGAKGIFRWDSPHHLGTAGLQERDFELGGLADAELIVKIGVDPHEAPADLLPDVPTAEVDLWHLVWDPADWSPGAIPRPPLYTDLSAVVMPAYEDDSVPFHPARAARELASGLPPGALIVADAGPAGFWVARTFPTTEPGSVIVPATRAPGFAAAAALVAGLDGRPAVAVTTAPVDPMTEAVLDLARTLGVAVDLRVWGDDPDVDFSRVDDLIAVAGPIVAWPR
jgi:hypothetical protein